MRHGDKVNNLGRKSSHRKAMISNMACSLIRHKRINTTIAKAKALKVFVEPLLTKSKTDSTHSRRVVFSYLQDKEIVTELFTRIIKTGYRLGDNAEMCLIELVDYNEIYSNESTKKNTRRSRRGGAKKATDNVEETTESTESTSDVVVDVASAEVVEEVSDAVVVEESTHTNEEVSTDSTEDSGEENNSTSDESETEPKKD